MKNLKVENGVIVGTSGDKHTSTNPVARLLIRNFDNQIRHFLRVARPRHLLEIGCGEGHITRIILSETDAQVHATDISESLVSELRSSTPSQRLSVEAVSIEALAIREGFDTVVCCEVLEHIKDPEAGLRRLVQLQASHYILSVPREPLFRTMNFVRGAYLKDFGNSPGHIHHWSTGSFVRMVSRHFHVKEVRQPVPWTALLCTPQTQGRRT